MVKLEKILMEWVNAFSNVGALWQNATLIGTYTPYDFGEEAGLKTDFHSGYHEEDNKKEEKRKEVA